MSETELPNPLRHIRDLKDFCVFCDAYAGRTMVNQTCPVRADQAKAKASAPASGEESPALDSFCCAVCSEHGFKGADGIWRHESALSDAASPHAFVPVSASDAAASGEPELWNPRFLSALANRMDAMGDAFHEYVASQCASAFRKKLDAMTDRQIVEAVEVGEEWPNANSDAYFAAAGPVYRATFRNLLVALES